MTTRRKPTAASADAVVEEEKAPAEEPVQEAEPPRAFRRDVMVRVQGGGLYLPARRRIQWMRGEVEAKPNWGITTEIIEHQRGKRIGKNKVEGGYALIKARVINEYGRVVGEGTKSEFSENFADYFEKAETGAIARALAVAGYGTESALDLDEGFEDDRLADAPVVTDAKVADTAKGGYQRGAMEPQVKEVSRLARLLEWTREDLTDFLTGLDLDGVEVPEMTGDNDADGRALRAMFTSMEADVIAYVINQLQMAAEAKARDLTDDPSYT